MKLARRYHAAQGAPERVHVISRTHSYHGTNGIGTGIAGIEANRMGFGEILPSASRVPFDSVDALREEITRIGPERVAAFLFEPVIGAGGVLLPPEGYVHGVVDVCREFGVLVIADAVICGFGRLGTWFGVERWGVEPDLITFAKGVTSGYLPLGGVVAHGGSRNRSGIAPATRCATARRIPATPPAAQQGWRTSISWSATACWSGAGPWKVSWPRRFRRWPVRLRCLILRHADHFRKVDLRWVDDAGVRPPCRVRSRGGSLDVSAAA